MLILHTKDTMIRSSPANVRAVQQTIKALRSQGHECAEFQPSLSMSKSFDACRLAHDLGRAGKEAMSTFVGLTTADGYKRMLSTIESDPKVRSLRNSEYNSFLNRTCDTGAKLVSLDSRSISSRSAVLIGQSSGCITHYPSPYEGFVRHFIAWAAYTFYGDKPFYDLFSLARSKSVSEFIEFTDRRNKVARAWYAEVSISDVARVYLDDFAQIGLG